jgi:hypothetical protein
VSPLVFLGLYALVCAAAFGFGLRMRRATPPEGVSAEQAQRFGRLLMMAATALLIIPAALWFHGDLKLGRL